MELNADEIVNKMNSIKDLKTKILIVRLFDEYQKVESTALDDVSLLKIKTALENLNEGLNKINFECNKYLKDEKLLNEIKEDFVVLKIHLRNFNKNNKVQVQKTIDLITKLECLLKLPITFKSNIGNVLEETLEYEKGKIKRGLSL